jgi:hypothetical protein
MARGPLDAARCPDCGGEVAGPFLLTPAGLRASRRRRVMGSALSTVHAYACLDCGALKLAATELTYLRDVARNHPDWLR